MLFPIKVCIHVLFIQQFKLTVCGVHLVDRCKFLWSNDTRKHCMNTTNRRYKLNRTILTSEPSINSDLLHCKDNPSHKNIHNSSICESHFNIVTAFVCPVNLYLPFYYHHVCLSGCLAVRLSVCLHICFQPISLYVTWN